MDPETQTGVHEPMRRLNWTTIALIGGLVLLVLVFAYFASTRNPDQDKLTDTQVTNAAVPKAEKRCASQATYDLMKRDLFRRAAQLRGSDQAAYDKLAAYAVLRMENPVMESEDGGTGAINCSGSVSLDLPPGVAVVGGRRTLTANVDYTVQPAADGTGQVLLLRNADAIIAPLATLARVGQPQPTAGAENNMVAPIEPVNAPIEPPAAPSQPQTPTPTNRPSFDCADARTRGEVMVCSDAGLSALDRNMAAQYGRALSVASPEQRDLLRRTRDRFLTFRDRCSNRACIGDTYTGRMREIRDIMEGRWQPPR